jgi:hypothetical protein
VEILTYCETRKKGPLLNCNASWLDDKAMFGIASSILSYFLMRSADPNYELELDNSNNAEALRKFVCETADLQKILLIKNGKLSINNEMSSLEAQEIMHSVLEMAKRVTKF